MQNESSNPKKKKSLQRKKQSVINIKALAIIWGITLCVLITAFFIGQFVIGDATYYDAGFPLLAAVTAFAAYVIQSVFSFSVVRNNELMRQEAQDNRKHNAELNARSEAFRTLQFIAAHYSVVDFIDYALLYEEYKQYTDKLREHKDFTFYLKEEGISEWDIAENFDNYKFATLKIPLEVIEGKKIGKLIFSQFIFTKENAQHRFIACDKGNESIVMYNEIDHRNEVVVNLIMRKDSEFFHTTEVTKFSKIKMFVTMQSFLGVEVRGMNELYFTNPKQLEENGANKYKIISSHFEVNGLPSLADAAMKEFDHAAEEILEHDWHQ